MTVNSHNELLRAAHKSRLWIVLGLTGFYLVAEVVGGILTGSLALLADAGHMLTDVCGIGLSLFALTLSERPATRRKTYGYYRAEILAATLNAALLILVAIYVLYEAYQRFQQPRGIAGGWMLAIACGGLAVNFVGMWILRGGARQSLNIRGAYLEVLGDMLGSLGVIVAATIVLVTGWTLADPIIGIGIGLFILPRAYSLLRESVDILLEAVPKGLDLAELRLSLEVIPGVREVHDLHAWSITRGMNALSGHVVVDDLFGADTIMHDAQRLLHERFNIDHSTLQIEPADFAESTSVHF